MRWYACGPEKSDDHDDDTELGPLGEREGHCGCLLTPRAYATPAHPSAIPDPSSTPSWAVILGGYYDGELCGTPQAARVQIHAQTGTDDSSATTIGALNWTPLSYDETFEKDGASLTRWTADTALLFGGLDSNYERCATLHTVQLHLVEGQTSSAETAEVDVRVSLPQPTTGDVPAARSRHAASLVDDCLWIFGGETETAAQCAELYVLDVTTLVWRRLRPTGNSPWPSARLLCSPLVRVSDKVVILYGGAHYVAGAIASDSDGWAFDLREETFTPLWGCVTTSDNQPPTAQLPSCNGHIGCPWWSRTASGDVAVLGAVFVAGKDASEGCDDVKCVRWSPTGDRTAETSLLHVAAERLETAAPTSPPHWRYTPVGIPCGTHGLLMVGGNCRHPKGASVYCLGF